MVDTGFQSFDTLETKEGRSQSPKRVTRQIVSDLMNDLHHYQRTVLGLLAMAPNQSDSAQTSGFSVANALRNLAVEIPGRDAYRLIALADSLDQGKDPLVELENFPQLVPPQTLVILRLAQSEGFLEELYLQIINRSSGPGEPLEVPQTRSKLGAYAELLFLSALFAFFVLKIIPQIIKIFHEFGMDMSAMNRFILIRIFDPASKILAVITPVALTIFLVTSLVWLFRKGLMLMGGLGVIGWQHPKRIRAIERLHFLAMVAGMRQSLASALMLFGTSKAMSSFLPKSSKLKQQIAQGVEPWTALSSRRVINSADAELVSQASPDTQVWLLRRIASKRARFRELRSVFWQRGNWFLFRCLLIFLTFTMSVFLFKMLVDLLNGLIQNEG